MEWYYVWWPWLTYKCIAQVCQHQLSFLYVQIIVTTANRTNPETCMYVIQCGMEPIDITARHRQRPCRVAWTRVSCSFRCSRVRCWTGAGRAMNWTTRCCRCQVTRCSCAKCFPTFEAYVVVRRPSSSSASSVVLPRVYSVSPPACRPHRCRW